jgi:hypothetical protein
VLGGWLVDVLSWRAIFFINVPIAVITLGIAFGHVPESRDQSEDSTVDWRGGFLVTVGLAALAYGLTATSEQEWTYISVSGSLLVSVIFMLTLRSSLIPATAPRRSRLQSRSQLRGDKIFSLRCERTWRWLGPRRFASEPKDTGIEVFKIGLQNIRCVARGVDGDEKRGNFFCPAPTP